MKAIDKIKSQIKANHEREAAKAAALVAKAKAHLAKYGEDIKESIVEYIVEEAVKHPDKEWSINADCYGVYKNNPQLYFYKFKDKDITICRSASGVFKTFVINDIQVRLIEEGFCVKQVGGMLYITIPEDEYVQDEYDITAKQKGLLAELERILLECRLGNLTFAYDVDESAIKAYNSKGRLLRWKDEDCSDKDGLTANPLDDMYKLDFPSVTHFFGDCYDDYYWFNK